MTGGSGLVGSALPGTIFNCNKHQSHVMILIDDLATVDSSSL